MVSNRDNLGFVGVGLRSVHYADVLEGRVSGVDFFEAISENFMDSKGRPRIILRKVREKFPIALHGVSLSIASTDPLDYKYLSGLDELYQEIDPIRTSDHLCWTGVLGKNGHDLFPIPYTNEAIEHIVNRIDEVQNYLRRELIFENVSAYLGFNESEMSEWEFVSQILEKSGAGFLCDLNNIYVNSFNFDFNPFEYLKRIDLKKIQQIHLAGFTDRTKFYFDTHSRPVCDEVWQMYKWLWENGVKSPVMVEWDQDIPDFDTLKNEALKVNDYRGEERDENSRSSDSVSELGF